MYSNPLSSSTGLLSVRADLALSEHVVGRSVLLPGVGFVEMAFAHHDTDNTSVLLAVAFVKPCILPGLHPKLVVPHTLRYTSQGMQTFEIASEEHGRAAVMGSTVERVFSMHVAGTLGHAGASDCMFYPEV